MPACLPPQVSGEVAGGPLCLPHVQQTHHWINGAAHRDRHTAGRASVRTAESGSSNTEQMQSGH